MSDAKPYRLHELPEHWAEVESAMPSLARTWATTAALEAVTRERDELLDWPCENTGHRCEGVTLRTLHNFDSEKETEP